MKTRPMTGESDRGEDSPIGLASADAAAGREHGEEPTLSLVGFATALLRRRRIVTRVSLFTVLAALASGFLRPALYTAESTFIPHGGRQGASELADLAARLGFTVPGTEDEPISFYLDLLSSRELLRAAAATEYRFAAHENSPDTIAGTLAEIYEIDAPDEERRLRAAAARLKDDAVVEINPASGVVKISVSAPWPALAEQINRRLLDLVNEFNVERRQSRAAAERRFVEARLAEAQRELRAAEEEAERFFEQNRRFLDSPQLRFEAARYERRISLHQQVYTTLATAYETARIEEVRNTPVITVVDGPEGSARFRGRGLILRGVLGAILGVSLATGLVLISDGLARQRQANPQLFSEFETLARDAAGALAPSRWMRRLRERTSHRTSEPQPEREHTPVRRSRSRT